ncbi:ABC transporter ATP-binding protein [Bradyrhizobium sp. U87765 SZCCT0131]|uniref:ABC transporter ATP-binding protein n=1 Tax=unclassified Bradyrhizobium TaxID=2631580 RepID=UPI001BA8EE49|nr:MULTISPECIES: ABC transporter ATP-binding protein [unclassified Bradyrhizobium]MBR1218564.1 ABC transporter ATP-binding protein [Bradyrhizobium sp. U87765 SZCCT0131]MBR1260490.1 ABC transporter ATP-binding protein [Bradyrhizobium sp. U87765 SZCCT0134]MBR1304062.1 ABC transporter ATP-binding protein [Bradyrhizobium sp. U87765 SZCCT0110]MBR1319668.1 ABC transporter ATP-binding protein [Bradyrhizobium sp. U87765 SZCCT0109]MBR1347993.1 ABC transporter ATP-binding protein [Bradyrhizobium sp. U87
MISLEVRGLTAGYGPIGVLHGLDFRVGAGEACVILGANGAGKTTTLRAISGVVQRAGDITFDGQAVEAWSADAIARAGIGHVPQGRGTFADMTVDDNLRVGGVLRKDVRGCANDRDFVLDLFPRLVERLSQRAGQLSGGEQQMLAIGRALMAAPRLLLLDEPSLGLSPLLTSQVFAALQRLRDQRGLTMLIVEQNAELSLALASRGYVLEAGQFVGAGSAAALMADDGIRQAYLGA